MSDLVYSVGNIFSIDKRDGALGHKGAEKYLIAPYQRGYKWASREQDDPVCLLMSDIINAFNSNAEQYYLQYITVKKNKQDEQNVLEVIDGQQRLTTLSLVFAVLANRLDSNEYSIAKNMLSYKVRESVSNFFEEYIYNDISNILEISWADFIKEDNVNDVQDIYYLFEAMHCINNELNNVEDIDKFFRYLIDNVQIILNEIEKGNASSEKIFSNLNTNKVDLTSIELVKGLLLTKVAREICSNDHFEKILEIRTMMGRQWDEMCNWMEIPSVKSFYFSEYTDPMDGLLKLVGVRKGYDDRAERTSKYSLFNFFQKHISKNGENAYSLFSDIRDSFCILKGWYEDDIIYNYLGFLFFHKSSDFKIFSLEIYLNMSKSKLKKELGHRVLKDLPNNIGDLEYGISDNEIHVLLLSLSVFQSDYRFDFESFSIGKWSLEHIFPQTPDDLTEHLYKKDIEFVNSLLVEDWEAKAFQKESLINGGIKVEDLISSLKIKLSNESCSLTSDEKDFLYTLIGTGKLNSIGNMALLTKEDNSSNSNGMFDKKRLNIVKRISKGSFVPKHTYDMFSKLLDKDMTADLTVWTETDIEVHEKWIENRIIEIKEQLQS